MSKYNAIITVDAADNTTSIYESIKTDESFYPENPVQTSISINKDECMIITAASENLAHLRANLNSTLRLIQASHGSIESVKI